MSSVKALKLGDAVAEEHLTDELERLYPPNPSLPISITGFDVECADGFTSVDIEVGGFGCFRGYAKRTNYNRRWQHADEQNDAVGLSVALARALRRAGLR